MTKTITTAAKIEELDKVLDMVDAFLQNSGCSDKSQYYIIVSVEEIFTNITSYAYDTDDGQAEISCEVVEAGGKSRLRIRFKDWGKAYNPLERPDPDFDVPFDERPIGGLGVYMVRSFMDAAEYRYEDGCNILTIEKEL